MLAIIRKQMNLSYNSMFLALRIDHSLFDQFIIFGRRSIRLYGDFYSSDMIVASPLGLVTVSSSKLPVIVGLCSVKCLIFLMTYIPYLSLDNYMVIVHSELFWRGTVKSVPFAYFLAIFPFSLACKWIFSLVFLVYLFMLLNEQLDEHYCAWLFCHLSILC